VFGRLGRLLASAWTGTLLLALVGAWSSLASFIPQGAASDPKVAAWASANPIMEPVVRAVGLHGAFTAPVFAVAVLLLAVSTALCSWQRTKAAFARSRALRAAKTVDSRQLAATHDAAIPCDPALGESEVLATASDTLKRLGIGTRLQGDVISSVSPSWTAWASPVFHWALLALIVTMPASGLLRSAGQIGVAVGHEKVDEPASYGQLSAGPLSGLFRGQRTIRVDAFVPNYKSGGVNRGPAPTVSVLGPGGEVIASQLVYPNNTLKTGTLTIYPVDYGLSVTVSQSDAAGADQGSSTELLDFSTETTEGTAPLTPVILRDAARNEVARAYIMVPLDAAKSGGLLGRLPTDLRARVIVELPDGTRAFDQEMRPGQRLALPGLGALGLVDIGYYARLQLVDDPSIPLLYVWVTVAMIGLSVATLARQQIVVAAAVVTPDGLTLAVRMRLWRNSPTDRDEIENELARALGGTKEEDAS
jgi:cytochrome c biogenesis protein ResB